MLVKDVCTLDVVCCRAETRAIAAARLMRHRHVGDLVIVDDPDGSRIPLGVVTDRDLAVEVLGNGLDPAETTVGSLMRHPVVIASESEDTGQLIERMRAHGVRRVPVCDDRGGVVGIVTLDDILKHLVDEAGALMAILDKGRKHEQLARR